MKVCMTAGGSGGHIFPAIALADACKAASMDVFFIGNREKMESIEVPKAGYPFFMIANKEFAGSIWAKAGVMLGQITSLFKALLILKRENPDLVIGFGGYVTVPVVLSAKLLRIPILLHEQNAVAGKANAFLSRFADGIAVCYPNTQIGSNHPDVRLIGNPRASVAMKLVPDKNLIREIGLLSDKKTALIVMGSLGSVSVNQILKRFVSLAKVSEHQYIIATGRKHYGAFVEGLTLSDNVAVIDFVDQVGLLSQIDLLIARGGATSAAEMLAKGVASIIIPSPYVPNDHQRHNALALVEGGASLCIEEKDLTEQRLFEAAEQLLKNDVLRQRMAMSAKALGFPDALDRMVGWVHEFDRK